MAAAYQVMPELTVEADIQYIQWAAYKGLDLKVTTPLGTITQPDDKKWFDATTLRVGGEYLYDEKITLRGGLIYDLTPQPPSQTELTLPDADRIDISLGGSYKINENIYVDAAYMLVLSMEKTSKISSPPGTYNTTAHVISVNVGYAF